MASTGNQASDDMTLDASVDMPLHEGDLAIQGVIVAAVSAIPSGTPGPVIDDFHVGDLVRLSGMTNNSQHNGRAGVLREFHVDSQRWKVFLPDQCTVFWVKNVHLSPLEAGGAG